MRFGIYGQMNAVTAPFGERLAAAVSTPDFKSIRHLFSKAMLDIDSIFPTNGGRSLLASSTRCWARFTVDGSPPSTESRSRTRSPGLACCAERCPSRQVGMPGGEPSRLSGFVTPACGDWHGFRWGAAPAHSRVLPLSIAER